MCVNEWASESQVKGWNRAICSYVHTYINTHPYTHSAIVESLSAHIKSIFDVKFAYKRRSALRQAPIICVRERAGTGDIQICIFFFRSNVSYVSEIVCCVFRHIEGWTWRKTDQLISQTYTYTNLLNPLTRQQPCRLLIASQSAVRTTILLLCSPLARVFDVC